MTTKITFLKITLLFITVLFADFCNAQNLEFRLLLDGNITDISGNNVAFSDKGEGVAQYVNDAEFGMVRSFNLALGYPSIKADTYTGVTGNNPRTVALWIKTDTTSKSIIIGWGNQTTGGRWETFVENGTNTVRVEFENGFSRIEPNVVINDNTWHHIAVTFDPADGGTAGSTKFYVDGVLRTNSAHATVVNTSDANEVEIASSFNPGNTFKSGYLSDVRVYSAALDATQIQTVMNTRTTLSSEKVTFTNY